MGSSEGCDCHGGSSQGYDCHGGSSWGGRDCHEGSSLGCDCRGGSWSAFHPSLEKESGYVAEEHHQNLIRNTKKMLGNDIKTANKIEYFNLILYV
jgi:hypothetical protein